MNKKLAGLMVAGVAVFALSGCGSSGGNDVVIVDPGPELVTLFLVVQFGVGVNVPYTCIDAYDEIIVDDFTIHGEFTFTVGDRCTFDLYDFPDSAIEPLFIEDIDGFGKDDIPYDCDNTVDFTSGITDFDGWFDYPVDAFCKFYL